jgi:DNA polymerase-3 subunit delta
MNFQTLKKELDNGVYRNLYIFSGDEREVMRKYIKRIAGDTPITRPDSIKSIAKALQTRSLFPSRRVYLLEDDKAVLDMNLSTLQHKANMCKDTVIIITFRSIDNRLKFFKDVKEELCSFDKYTEQQLVGFIVKQVQMPEEVALQLAKRCGNDVARIESECNKLKHFTSDVPPFIDDAITLEMLRDIVAPTLEDRIFEMIDAVATKKLSKAFSLYKELLDMKESPIKIVSLLYTKFRQIFLLQYYSGLKGEIGQNTGMNPWQIKMTQPLVGHFQTERLLKIMKQIQSAEVKMKTGQMDMSTGMDVLMINILA